ncbi:TIGR00645 family protein [Methanobrevibacter curvatus]|uniref:Uncharacterized protein n=1 Tax=Methanobrevibacter curvatus TaxID=49547 RepID=A0A166AE33_9EURY|nr:TIGR00645 family protein [Methanobrevibacter curvatus]KZX11916.1 hypothetical protein MBCUR_12400 [Methanobrevibacter curvatus]
MDKIDENNNDNNADSSSSENGGIIEDTIEKIIFQSRWVLAPIFLGLVVALILVLIKFFQILIGFVPEVFAMSFDELAMAILNLLDIALLGNLLLIVIFSGYENFVSKIDHAVDHEDRPSWMGHLDFSGLKIKIVGSIVAISLIELLHDFLGATEHFDPNVTFWRIVLHIVFVISGVLFALMDYIAEKRHVVTKELHE